MKIVEDNYRHKGLRQQMVNQLRADGITDERVLAALQQKDMTQKALLDALKNYLKETKTNV